MIPHGVAPMRREDADLPRLVEHHHQQRPDDVDRRHDDDEPEDDRDRLLLQLDPAEEIPVRLEDRPSVVRIAEQILDPFGDDCRRCRRASRRRSYPETASPIWKSVCASARSVNA